jgi:hypothetical protein
VLRARPGGSPPLLPLRPPSVRELARVAFVALVFLAAPTAGDIGSCNQTADGLDPNKFFLAKQAVDCQRCQDCGFTTTACTTACGAAMGGTFPDQCYPVEHDGEVCLDALLAASCGDYQSYVADEGSTVPTECDFCPPRDAGAE